MLRLGWFIIDLIVRLDVEILDIVSYQTSARLCLDHRRRLAGEGQELPVMSEIHAFI